MIPPPNPAQIGALALRATSSLWMIFYAGAFAVFYSAAHLSDSERKCIQGHPVAPGASFCDQCGQPVVQPATGAPAS
jgi:hypothetical protein